MEMTTNIYDADRLKDRVFYVSRTLTDLSIIKKKDSIEMASRDLVRLMADFLVRNPKLTRIESTDVFGATMVRIEMQVVAMSLKDLRNLLEEAFIKGVRHAQGVSQ